MDNIKTTKESLCGIDEAGRGPLAGPLVMAGVVIDGQIEGLRDSKRLNLKERERLYELIITRCPYRVVVYEANVIDLWGLSRCIGHGLEEIKSKTKASRYLFDGNSAFGVQGIETLVGADDKVDAVSAASIVAKVVRDRLMDVYAKQFPQYGFERHKGYGTKEHVEAIKRNGRSKIHRRTFRIKAIDAPPLFEP